MEAEPTRLTIPSDSDLARRLRVAEKGYLEVDTGDRVYGLYVTGLTPGKPRPDAVARSGAGMRRSAGSWKDVDVDAFKAYLAERRRVHPRPSIRL